MAFKLDVGLINDELARGERLARPEDKPVRKERRFNSLEEWIENERQMFILSAKRMGVDESYYRRTIKHKGNSDWQEEDYKVIGLNPSARKWKVLLRGMSGKEGKATLDELKQLED